MLDIPFRRCKDDSTLIPSSFSPKKCGWKEEVQRVLVGTFKSI